MPKVAYNEFIDFGPINKYQSRADNMSKHFLSFWPGCMLIKEEQEGTHEGCQRFLLVFQKCRQGQVSSMEQR